MASISAAPDSRARLIRSRARLVQPWTLLGFAGLAAAALALLFPRRELLDLVTHPGPVELTEVYLTNLHGLDPDNPRLALLLAKARAAQGRFDEALALATPFLRSNNPSLRREALWLRLDFLRTAHARQRKGKDEHDSAAALAAAVRASLEEHWSSEELFALAADAQAAGDRALLRAIHERLAPLERDPGRLEVAARRSLALADYRLAARLFFLARVHAREPLEARRLYLEGVHSLQAGDLPAEALAAAEKELGSLAGDEEVMLELVRLARAANRPDVAARYMKQLLWPRPATDPGKRIRDAFAALGAALVSNAWAASDPLESTRPYEARVYGFAYEVFLENGDLDAAYRVARAAVAQRPGEAIWRERLARVAEQSGRLLESLAAWRWLAEHTDAAEAWQAVLRLAPGLDDDEALASALRRELERPQARPSDLGALAAVYERLGRPEEGADWLEARYRRSGEIAALELAADLAERSGQSQRAIALHTELLGKAEPTPERLLRLATLQILAGKFAEAHTLLRQFRSRAGAGAHRYWELLADLAWALQEDASALEVFGVLAAREEATAGDFHRLVALLRPNHPEEAARMALAGFARFKTPGLLVQAIEGLWEKRDMAALRRLFAGLSPADERLFAQTPYFYRLRSRFRQSSGDPAGARADLQRAIAIAPQDPQHRLAMIWLLIESRDKPGLRRALIAAAPAQDSAAWPAFASGWMMLEEPRRALPFFARLAQASPRDFLWLSAYADALEQDGRHNAADRIRRHAWTIARSASSTAGAAADREGREHLARLALRQAPGDPAMRVLRDLLRRDNAPRTAHGERERDAAVSDLVLSWLISTEQHEQAKAWLWERHARRLASPAWAELAVAAAEGDAQAAGRLLDAPAAELTAAQRAEAARIAQRPSAQALAFDALAARPDDDSLHQPLAETLLESANRAEGGLASTRRGVLQSRARAIGSELALGDRLRLAVEWRDASQTSLDESVLRGVPRTDRELRAGLRQPLQSGWVEAGLGAREAFADTTSARLRHYYRWSRRFSTLASASHNDRTLDSAALAAAGMRDELSLRALYELSKTEYLGGRVFATGYRSQTGVRLGGATGYESEAGHRVRIDYPDLTVRVLAAEYHSRARGEGDPATAALNPAGTTPEPAFFVPAGSRRYGIGAAVGESAREGRTRALRPYCALDLTRNSVTGGGYNARLGLRGSAFGQDQFHLYWSRGRSVGAGNDAVLDYGIRYEHYFDRL